MRWLFAMLIALFCWTGSVSGQKLCAAPPKATPTALGSQPSLADAALSPYESVYRAPAEARRKAPGKLPQLLPRSHSFSGSPLASAQLVPAYTLAAELGHRVRTPRQDAPVANRLAQVDWTLHSSQQQSRLGGWKESNMLYRGTLTYHS
ncbi:hypothetical protein [Serratia entomophila]|uniref:hypothetical protein n=1 Tax=Serratia entomophila TaxID=42906 RepID=UPI00217BF669|nr:hypothetical protein [Serratia entomophila]CAI1027162.1 Uncharacterised protein [Serratia entomophila]CAI1028205.1 Uncharacterised protein [Serratia entomophila]CAI1028379.1 Uncharacterised protein [Serratia entomophila]CAI1840038.1 Uncharacterised protein [Serratia entomophila]CAI1848963.1 Uncharacterised protein [Serratia entomophila]